MFERSKRIRVLEERILTLARGLDVYSVTADRLLSEINDLHILLKIIAQKLTELTTQIDILREIPSVSISPGISPYHVTITNNQEN